MQVTYKTFQYTYRMKRRPAFPDRFVFSWCWQNETKYEKQELLPLYWLIISYYSCTT